MFWDRTSWEATLSLKKIECMRTTDSRKWELDFNEANFAQRHSFLENFGSFFLGLTILKPVSSHTRKKKDFKQASNAKSLKWLNAKLQGDHSACSKPPVGIKTKVLFLYLGSILKRNFCFEWFDVNGRFLTSWMVILSSEFQNDFTVISEHGRKYIFDDYDEQ